mgnify:CR=1 FL=1
MAAEAAVDIDNENRKLNGLQEPGAAHEPKQSKSSMNGTATTFRTCLPRKVATRISPLRFSR